MNTKAIRQLADVTLDKYGKQRTLAAIRAGQCRPPALRP